jgi:Na+/proline symporter
VLGGSASLSTLIDGFSVELATILFTLTIAVYTLMGGLSAAFYVSYFNTGAIMIMMMTFLLKIFFDHSESDNPLGKTSTEYLFTVLHVWI